MTVEQLDAAHHPVERGPAQSVVHLARPVDADAHKEALIAEETAPLVGEQRAVGLQAVVYVAAAGIAPLQRQRPAVKRQRAQQGLAAVPREEHVGRRLGLDVLPGEALEHSVVDGLATATGIQRLLLGVVTVAAMQVATRPGRLEHDVKRARKR